MKKEIIVHQDPKAPVSEMFRTLRTNIQFMNTNKKMSTLLVTSTSPGEGKSWVSANLAVTFAQAGKRVILVDADMRKGRQYVMFGVSPRPGLSNFLSQEDLSESTKVAENIVNYIQETEVENLFVITAGSIPPNPSELLGSNQMSVLLNGLKELCDLVVIDGTPCELVTDSIILSRVVDSTIIVTAHKKTKKDVLERIVKNIQNVGGKLAGVVINKVPISSKAYGERYYYYGEDKTVKGNKKKRKEERRHSNSKIEEKNKKRIEKDLINKKEHTVTPKELDNTLNKQPIGESAATKNGVEETVTDLNKTSEILKQINDYIEKEKKDLK